MIDSHSALQFRSSFFDLADQAQNIIITSHYGPDDDSISSVLSLYFILHEKYPEKNIRIIYSSERNDRWHYFENFEKIKFVSEIADEIASADLLIGLDASIYSRFSRKPDGLKNAACKKIGIDHHGNPSDSFDLLFVDPTISSNSEIIYTLFYQDRATIPPRTAETILLGILGDTGNLRFVNAQQVSAFAIVSRLVVEGNIDIAFLESQYSTFSSSTFTVMQELMKNTEIKNIPGWPPVLTSYISREYVEKNRVADLDVSAARNIFIASYGTRITGITWSIMASAENEGEVKVSLRSLKDSVNVRELMQKMGVGGGHDRAAGGKFEPENGVPADALPSLEKIFAWMSEHPLQK